LCLAWKKNDEHLVVKVILVLHVAFSFHPSNPPMLSVFLSVEELELLVIRHVFENHLHFLAFVAHFCLNFFLSSSSHGSNPSSYRHHRLQCRPLSLPHLPQFLFFLQNRKCTEKPHHVKVYEIIFPTIHHMHETGSEQESCANFTPAMQSVQG
jgi:hypothetical protein